MKTCEFSAICHCHAGLRERMPSTAAMISKRYCEAGGTDCARSLLYRALGPGKVPADLYPGQLEKAAMILRMADAMASPKLEVRRDVPWERERPEPSG